MAFTIEVVIDDNDIQQLVDAYNAFADDDEQITADDVENHKEELAEELLIIFEDELSAILNSDTNITLDEEEYNAEVYDLFASVFNPDSTEETWFTEDHYPGYEFSPEHQTEFSDEDYLDVRNDEVPNR